MASTGIYLLSQQKNALRIGYSSIPRGVLFTSASPAGKTESFASCSSRGESKRDSRIDVIMARDRRNPSLPLHCRGQGKNLNMGMERTQYHFQGEEKSALQNKNW